MGTAEWRRSQKIPRRLFGRDQAGQPVKVGLVWIQAREHKREGKREQEVPRSLMLLLLAALAMSVERTRSVRKLDRDRATPDALSLYVKRAGRRALLTRQEEGRLARRIMEGDRQAWEELVIRNLRLVTSVARGYVGRGLELTDLIQEGNLGLMRAAETFDAGFGTKFSTYATKWVKRYVIRAIYNKGALIRVPTHAVEEEQVMMSAHNALYNATGQNPTPEEVADFLDKGVEEVEGVLKFRKTIVSSDIPVGSDRESTIADLLADEEEAHAEEQAIASVMSASVRELLADLSERDRYVIERRYGLDGGTPGTLEEIGEEIGVTRQRVGTIQSGVLKRLRRAFEEAPCALADETPHTARGQARKADRRPSL